MCCAVLCSRAASRVILRGCFTTIRLFSLSVSVILLFFFYFCLLFIFFPNFSPFLDANKRLPALITTMKNHCVGAFCALFLLPSCSFFLSLSLYLSFSLCHYLSIYLSPREKYKKPRLNYGCSWLEYQNPKTTKEENQKKKTTNCPFRISFFFVKTI